MFSILVEPKYSAELPNDLPPGNKTSLSIPGFINSSGIETPFKR